MWRVRSEVEKSKSGYITILDEIAAAKREKIVAELQPTKDFITAWFERA